MSKSEYDESILNIDCEKIRRILVGFIADEVRKTGLEVGVIGLSGGVDSALSAALSAQALGAENILCAILPHKDSSADSAADAELVAEQLGVRTRRIDITPLVEPYFELYEPEADRIRRGNVMARARMIVLYDLSRKEGGLVIGTSNRTEILLGYCTLWGDSACAVNPLGDLLKSQVWKLAEHMGLPEHIIAKAPSADLWAGQTDEEELGLDYRAADLVLTLLVDRRLSVESVARAGFAPELIERISETMRRTQFKRMGPVIAKLGNRTVGRDFRYPRDWGL